MRIAVVSEEITARPAGGILVFLMQMCRYLSDRYELLVVHERGDEIQRLNTIRVPIERSVLFKEPARALNGWKPDVTIFAPACGISALGMLRSVLLKRRVASPLIVVSLKDSETGRAHRILSLLSAPDLVLSPVKKMRLSLENLRINTDFIMPGYNPDLFKPVDRAEKIKLRKKLGIPENKFIVLHVGNVKENRNLQAFLRYRDWGTDILPLIKAGEIVPVWRDHLRQAGVIVMDEYTEAIHEIYQASDLYLFPVRVRSEALEFPLSVIEAAACNLPILTTPFGSLPEILENGVGLEWFMNVTDIPAKIEKLRSTFPGTKAKVSDLSWERMFDRYLRPHLENLSCSDSLS
jgi:glycosyltransferase involved in cell wall biosynthesis